MHSTAMWGTLFSECTTAAGAMSDCKFSSGNFIFVAIFSLIFQYL